MAGTGDVAELPLLAAPPGYHIPSMNASELPHSRRALRGPRSGWRRALTMRGHPRGPSALPSALHIVVWGCIAACALGLQGGTGQHVGAWKVAPSRLPGTDMAADGQPLPLHLAGASAGASHPWRRLAALRKTAPPKTPRGKNPAESEWEQPAQGPRPCGSTLLHGVHEVGPMCVRATHIHTRCQAHVCVAGPRFFSCALLIVTPLSPSFPPLPLPCMVRVCARAGTAEFQGSSRPCGEGPELVECQGKPQLLYMGRGQLRRHGPSRDAVRALDPFPPLVFRKSSCPQHRTSSCDLRGKGKALPFAAPQHRMMWTPHLLHVSQGPLGCHGLGGNAVRAQNCCAHRPA